MSSSKINPTKESIKLFSKQIRTPSFVEYEDIIRQLGKEQSYEHFLMELMKREVSQRQENQQKRKVKAAKFPYPKTLDEFDFSRLENVSSATMWELASCDFINKKQNVVMIGSPGSGNYRKILFMEINKHIF
ncbi:ATP-binding protein [Virgibacillus sp. DJP39]|uniref:ATP-binding protein n=1 Tax=Virgibacillus sp. DJP39 TaxID=3409790 RepID=UPI003BB6DB1E